MNRKLYIPAKQYNPMRNTYVSKLLNSGEEAEIDKLLECVLGLSSSDVECYRLILENQPTWTDELSEKLDKDESTVHRYVSSLSESGLITEERVPYENGGYKHEYKAKNPEEIAQSMRLLTSEWGQIALDEVDKFEKNFEHNTKKHR